MKTDVSRRTDSRRGVLGIIASALVGFARRAGGSLHRHPMPELREVSREWRRTHIGA